MPIVLARPKVPPVKVKEAAAWKQKDEDVWGIACHSYGGGGVTIASTLHLRVYKQIEGKMFHSTVYEEDDVCDVTTFDGRNHAVLDRKHGEVRLYYNWPIFHNNENHTIRVRGKAGYCISGTENYLVYSARQNSMAQIVCFSVAASPRFKWQLGLGSFAPRSLSAMEKKGHLMMVVAQSCRSTKGSLKKNATALIALNGKSKMWVMAFEALDKNADRFDLIDMCNDGCYFYVLNAVANCVYLVSVDGNVLFKTLQNLDRPLRMAANSESKDLVVASGSGTVTVYKLLYKKQ